ncbi:MAG: group II intron reverse transcriptase/maturase [Verrucomicrobia bacterium 12-59-8]|nr:MAG: group II intron reverse transcriptase/maturase [Verrucomicrobia bacterium 12-59-8]
MLMALERGVKGGVWFSLIDKIWAERTLQLAWEQVQSNAGACGVDGISVAHFEKDSQTRLLAVKEHLIKGSYQPKPVRRVYIPKPGSSEPERSGDSQPQAARRESEAKQKRPLGIPTVTDRIVQTAVKMVIEPIFEREFAEHSHGFRPGRSCRDALRRVEELLQSGLVHVVDVDIKGCFDSIPHQRLLELVGERIADGRVLALIESFLKQGIMDQAGEIEPGDRVEGTPQGGSLSPLLANIYLNPLDHLMSRRGVEMVRYADDMVMLCRDAQEALTTLQALREWAARAGLELHAQKTKIVEMGQPGSHFDFLGYRFWRSKTSGRIRRFIRPKSMKKMRGKLKPFTRRTSGQSMSAIARVLRPRLAGFFNYFKHAAAVSLTEMDKWVRMRLRSILRKRAGRHGKARGLDHQRWPNSYFAKLGVFNLEEARKLELMSLRAAANF